MLSDDMPKGKGPGALSPEGPADNPCPTVPWPAAQTSLCELYSLTGDQFAAVLQQWQRGDPDFLRRLGDHALLALHLAAEAECYARFELRVAPRGLTGVGGTGHDGHGVLGVYTNA